MVPPSPTRQVVAVAAACVAGLVLVAAGVIVGTASGPNSGRSADAAPARSTDHSKIRVPAALASIVAPAPADPALLVPALEGVAGPPGPPPAPAPDPSPAPVLYLLPELRPNRSELATEPTGPVLEPVIPILEEAPEAPTPPATPSPVELLPLPMPLPAGPAPLPF